MRIEPRRPSWAAGFLLFGSLAAGCQGPPAETDVVPVLTDPAITTLAWACDVDTGTWSLAVLASSWSGGGALWLTSDGSYAERHPVRVKTDQADGLEETLALDLAIESDWRDVSLGSSTAFLCADAPAFRFILNDRASEPTDCRFAGPVDVWEQVPDVSPCDIAWVPDP